MDYQPNEREQDQRSSCLFPPAPIMIDPEKDRVAILLKKLLHPIDPRMIS